MKKENLIVIFYVVYFSWLFTVAYINPETNTLNYFTVIVAFFYLIFLREKGDLLLFWLGALVPMLLASFSIKNLEPKFDLATVSLIPIWLPVAWGTTIVALRKLYILITK